MRSLTAMSFKSLTHLEFEMELNTNKFWLKGREKNWEQIPHFLLNLAKGPPTAQPFEIFRSLLCKM